MSLADGCVWADECRKFNDGELTVPEQAIHPSPAELHAYGLGQLSYDQATVVESHISECEPCCETIADLSAGDTFVELLQEAEQLPIDQNVDHDGLPTRPSSSSQDIPVPLAKHPRYEIVGLIGRGGIGNVYEARHRKMERTVALKVLNRKFVRKTVAVDRFHREVKTAAQLSHPNIVTAHDADNAGDYHFMVMEFVDGVDLSRIIKDRGALPVIEACKYIHQAALGLHYAHEQGMVHRDIKPHNLMLTADGTVKILDFGLASLAPEVAPEVAQKVVAATDTGVVRSELTVAGAIMGTPDFISPEQAKDARQADVRSDIYSLGATLYHLLSGRPPFDDGSVMHKLTCHAQVEPERLESLRDDIPAELDAIVTRMMAKDPDERFQTPAAVAAALKSFLQAIEPAQQSPPLQAQAARKRNRWLPLTAVATLFIAMIVAGIVFYLETGNGTIRVELMDESLEATIMGEKIEVEDGDKEFEISAGRQQLVIRQKGSDSEFVTNKFRIYRNDEIKFEVRLIAGEVMVSKDGKYFDSKPTESLFPLIGAAFNQEPVKPSIAGAMEAKSAYVLGTGKVVAFSPQERQQSVRSPVKGFVRRIAKGMVEGAKIKRGQFIVEIEPHVAQLETSAKDLETKMATVKAIAEASGRNIIDLEAARVAAVAAAAELITAAKAKWDAKKHLVVGYEAQEWQVRLNHERQKALFDKGVSSKQEVEKSQRDWDVACSELESARLDVTAAMDEWEARKSERVQKERAAEAKVVFARAMQKNALDQAARIQKEIRDIEVKLSELNRLEIKAPRDGTLFRLNVLEPGQALKEGDELFTIVPNSSERAVELLISGDDLPLVEQGDRVRLQFEGWPVAQFDGWPWGVGAFGGEVIDIDTTADGSGNFRILVKPDGKDSWPDEQFLRPGVRANGWILTGSRSDRTSKGN